MIGRLRSDRVAVGKRGRLLHVPHALHFPQFLPLVFIVGAELLWPQLELRLQPRSKPLAPPLQLWRGR